MAIPLVAFDESGNSGANLLDSEQPVFVLASVHLSDDATKELVGVDGKELKFARLKRSKQGRKRIVDILNSPSLGPEQVLVSGIHKPFMVITKMVDLLVEPLTHTGGIDLYARGANLGLANMWHFVMPVCIGRKRFEALKVAFVNMVRTPMYRNIDQFYSIVSDAIVHVSLADFVNDLAMLLATRRIAESYMNDWDSSDLDPAIPAFADHASMWTATLSTEFVIAHDESKPLVQQQVILEAMMSTKEETVVIGYDRRKKVFPVRANGIEFRNSSECPQIQVADIVAGAVAHSLRQAFHTKHDSFADELLSTRTLGGFFHPLWPEPKFTPEELGTDVVGGIDANDYVGQYIACKLGGIPPKGKRKKK